ncbi:MAG: AAA family ATPase, partial [Chitinivibrionales bacterium]|nr:AAA family ATPase [Chitinivibrionales bacterium]
MKSVESHYTYTQLLATLRKRVAEPAPAFIQIVSGPRQVGKTTALLSLQKEDPEYTLYTTADAPEAALSIWWEQLWSKAEDLASKRKSLIIIDEIQSIPDWSRRLKVQTDRIHRLDIPLHIIASGSSALH